MNIMENGVFINLRPHSLFCLPYSNPATPCCYWAFIAAWRSWRANLAPERNHVHVQRVTQFGRDFGLQPIHVARRAVPIFLRRPDPAQPPGDPPAMGIDRENLPVQRIHQNASRHFLADTRQRQQKLLGLRIAHLVQMLQRRLAEFVHDDVEQFAYGAGLLVRQSAAGDRPRNIFGGRFGDSQVGGKGFFQRTICIAVARFASFCAANDEQQFVQRVFEVVVVEVAVARFQRRCDLPDRRWVFERNHIASLSNSRAEYCGDVGQCVVATEMPGYATTTSSRLPIATIA